jgi:hypothetical protein
MEGFLPACREVVYLGPHELAVAFLPACLSTSGRIHGEFLRLFFLLANKKADDYFAALGYQPHKQEFCHRRSVFFQQTRCTMGMAFAQAVAIRGAPATARRYVAAPGTLVGFRVLGVAGTRCEILLINGTLSPRLVGCRGRLTG